MTLFRDPRAGLSKGCGLVAMGSHEQAAAALAGLNEKLQVEVRPKESVQPTDRWARSAQDQRVPAAVQGSFSPLVVKWSVRGQRAAREEQPAVGEKRKAPREHGDPTNTEVLPRWQPSLS